MANNGARLAGEQTLAIDQHASDLHVVEVEAIDVKVDRRGAVLARAKPYFELHSFSARQGRLVRSSDAMNSAKRRPTIFSSGSSTMEPKRALQNRLVPSPERVLAPSLICSISNRGVIGAFEREHAIACFAGDDQGVNLAAADTRDSRTAGTHRR